MSTLINGFVIAFLSLAVLGGSSAYAATKLHPVWMKSECSRISENISFLNNETSRQTESLSEFIVDRKTALSMRQEYDDLVRWHEMRERYGLNSNQDDRVHTAKVSELTTDILKRIEMQHVRKNSAKLRKIVETDPTFAPIISKVRRPVGLVFAVAGIYTGEPMNVQLSERTRLTARTNVPAKRGQLFVASPLMNGSVDFIANASSQEKEERYRFSVSRNLPVFDLSSSLSYGTTTNAMTASLSRPLFVPNLTAVMDASTNEQVLRFLYGLTF
jgi:hypothetical protein